MATLPSSLNSVHLPILAHHRLSSPSRSISDRSPIFCPSRFLGDRLLLLSSTRTPTAVAFRSSCFRMMGNLCVGKAHKWWEKGLEPNMKEITSATHLIESLLTAGDKLVVIDFFAPGCGGGVKLSTQSWRSRIQRCFFSKSTMKNTSPCVAVSTCTCFHSSDFTEELHGRLCSFSRTNATIKKF